MTDPQAPVVEIDPDALTTFDEDDDPESLVGDPVTEETP